jgi:hypothetical protein
MIVQPARQQFQSPAAIGGRFPGRTLSLVAGAAFGAHE